MSQARAPKAPAKTSMVDVAQLVELLVVVQAVAGSNPVVHPSCRTRSESGPEILGQDLGQMFGYSLHGFVMQSKGSRSRTLRPDQLGRQASGRPNPGTGR